MVTLSLKAREIECGAESLAVAASLQSLTSVMLATGRAAEAEALCQRCLKIRCVIIMHPWRSLVACKPGYCCACVTHFQHIRQVLSFLSGHIGSPSFYAEVTIYFHSH